MFVSTISAIIAQLPDFYSKLNIWERDQKWSSFSEAQDNEVILEIFKLTSPGIRDTYFNIKYVLTFNTSGELLEIESRQYNSSFELISTPLTYCTNCDKYHFKDALPYDAIFCWKAA